MGRRKKHSGRNQNSYDRRKGNRKPRLCMLIVCEGSETEPNYFREFRNDRKLKPVEVEIIGEGKAPITVVDYALKLEKRRSQEARSSNNKLPYDKIWCVIDVENPVHNPSFQQAVEKAKKNGFELAISNPAFEFWYLLHFEHTTSPFQNAGELINRLESWIPDYDKSKSYFLKLKDKMKNAIERARNLLINHPDCNTQYPNPSTTVHELVDCLIESQCKK